MKISGSFTGRVRVKLTSADLNSAFSRISQAGIQINDLVLPDELNAQMCVFRGDYHKLTKLCVKHGDELEVLEREGLFWKFMGMLRRPVLLGGMLILLLCGLWIPKHVFFLRVVGNSSVPTRLILEEAEKCGIGFGAERRAVRSEQVKNALLEAVPQLQWVGVNTEGCVAVITVRERTPVLPENQQSGLGHIVALRDGVILDCTAIRGSLLCTPGQAVTEGQILISGYTDCGIAIRAEQAEGEVYALTRREFTAAALAKKQIRVDKVNSMKKISLLFGKKRINLWKDSGIWDSTCDRMYEEYYITLPGGFRLPVCIIVERYQRWETREEAMPETEGKQLLSAFGASYLQQQMVAGTIRSGEQSFQFGDGRMTMAGQYICIEMIGKMQKLQIGDNNGENN